MHSVNSCFDFVVLLGARICNDQALKNRLSTCGAEQTHLSQLLINTTYKYIVCISCVR